MELGRVHPEFAQMYQGMKSGHLSTSHEQIRHLEDSFTPQNQQDRNGTLQHPEYADYCQYARSLGYGCKC